MSDEASDPTRTGRGSDAIGADEASEAIRNLETLCAGEAGALAFPALAEAHRRAGRPEAAERVARQGLARAPQALAGRVALGLALLDQKRMDEARLELERILGADAGASRAAGGFALRDDPDAEPAWPVEADPEVEPPASVEGEGAVGGLPRADASVFGDEGVHESELEAAFEEAETDREQVVDADDVARAALDALPEEEDDDEAMAFPAEEDDVVVAFDAEARPIALEVESDAPDAPEDHAEGDAFVAALAEDAGSPFATETVADLLERQGRGPEAQRIRAHLSATEPPTAPGPEPPTAASPEAPTPEPPTAASPEPPGSPEPEPDRRRRATLERWLTNIRRDTR